MNQVSSFLSAIHDRFFTPAQERKTKSGFFEKMPNRLITHIGTFCDLQTQGCFALANTRLKTEVAKAVEVLKIAVPDNDEESDEESLNGKIIKFSPQVLVNLLARCPNIVRVSFGERCFKGAYQTFSVDHEHLIRPVISFLKKNYPKKLKHVVLEEICFKCDNLQNNRQKMRAASLTSNLFKAFCHSQTLSLVINIGRPIESLIPDDLIDTCLEKSHNLTALTIRGSLVDKVPLSILLSKCRKLEKLSLAKYSLAEKTVVQLSLCHSLTELRIDEIDGSEHLEKFLCQKHGLPLRLLNLGDTECLANDEKMDLATLQLKDLESFTGKVVSKKGLIKLAQNCTKLREVDFDFSNITDKEIAEFAQNVPHLRNLHVRRGRLITQRGICALTQHCTNLETLGLTEFLTLTPAVLVALAQNCKKLQSLNLVVGDTREITFQSLKDFANNCKSLKVLNIDGCDGIKLKDIRALRKEFPHISIRFVPSIKG